MCVCGGLGEGGWGEGHAMMKIMMMMMINDDGDD